LEDLYRSETLVIDSPNRTPTESDHSSTSEEDISNSTDDEEDVSMKDDKLNNIEYALVFQNEDICSMVELSCVNILANFSRLKTANGMDDFSEQEKKKPKRHRVTKEELDILESIFQKNFWLSR